MSFCICVVCLHYDTSTLKSMKMNSSKTASSTLTHMKEGQTGVQNVCGFVPLILSEVIAFELVWKLLRSVAATVELFADNAWFG